MRLRDCGVDLDETAPQAALKVAQRAGVKAGLERVAIARLRTALSRREFTHRKFPFVFRFCLGPPPPSPPIEARALL
jgi:hypothetical protein